MRRTLPLHSPRRRTLVGLRRDNPHSNPSHAKRPPPFLSRDIPSSLPPLDSSSAHHDLHSFLAHAARTGLSPRSTTFAGTHYEYTVQRALARYGMKLRRIGGRADGGIDLIGEWRLPVPEEHAGPVDSYGRSGQRRSSSSSLSSSSSSSSVSSSSSSITPTDPSPPPPPPIKVLVQCKALKRPPTPQLVRELEGAFAAAPAGWRSGPIGDGSEGASGGGSGGGGIGDGKAGAGGVLGVLVAPCAATRGVREALGRSRQAMAFFMVALGDHGSDKPEGAAGEGAVAQCLWNRAAGWLGLEGVGVTMRYSLPSPSSASASASSDPPAPISPPASAAGSGSAPASESDSEPAPDPTLVSISTSASESASRPTPQTGSTSTSRSRHQPGRQDESTASAARALAPDSGPGPGPAPDPGAQVHRVIGLTWHGRLVPLLTEEGLHSKGE